MEFSTDQLDHILEAQLAVSWAGEGETDPPRLGWWRTSLSDEFGGEDLFRRLTPKTWRWAALEAARAAAARVDGVARQRADDADHLVTVFRLGVALDAAVDERLRELKISSIPPTDAFPAQADLFVHLAAAEVEIAGPEGSVTHPRIRSGQRTIDYRLYTKELTRKPQALRSVGSERVADPVAPFTTAWEQLCEIHGPKDGARAFAKVLRFLEDQGHDLTVDRLDWALE